jgi:hypothetical protein
MKAKAERINFISGLEIEMPTIENSKSLIKGKPYTNLIAENKNSAWVNDGSIVTFTDDVNIQHQQDVLDSTLLAQLAANKKHDRVEDPENWYKFYKEILENIGWVINTWNFEEYHASGSTFIVDEVIMEILGTIATGKELDVVKVAISTLKSLANSDNRLVLFNESSYKISKGNFQVLSVSENNNIVSINTSLFYFSSTQTVVKLLLFSFSSSKTKLFKGSESVTINDVIYGQVRNSITTKLGTTPSAFLVNIDI